MAPLPSGVKTTSGAIAVSTFDNLYVIAGQNSKGSRFMSYSIDSNQWSILPDGKMHCSHSHGAATIYGNCLYLAGGTVTSDHPDLTDAIEVYNFLNSDWKRIRNVLLLNVALPSSMKNHKIISLTPTKKCLPFYLW